MKKILVFFSAGALAVLGFLVWAGIFDFDRGKLKVNFFNVGQGDAVFIETPLGQQILIDGGPDSSVLEKLAKEMPFWDRTIDLVILSHPEADHMSGLIEVLDRYWVKNIMWTGVVRNTAEYKEWAKALEKEKANIIIAKAGEKLSFPGKLSFQVLHPFNDWQGREIKDSNGTSIVVKLVFSSSTFLFTGDALAFQEKEMILRGENLDSDILKAGHHGSKTSSSQEFIEAVSPETVIISAGQNNQYGHPHREVLERFLNYGTKILRTDQVGDIKIITNQ